MYDRVLLELHHRFRAKEISKGILTRALEILDRDREDIEDCPESDPEDIADNIIILASL